MNTHLWHLKQLSKIQYDQDLLKFHEKFLKTKTIKQFYRYRPIRSSVADIEEVINKEEKIFSNREKNEKNNTKIEIKFYSHNFFRGKRIVCNNNNECIEGKQRIKSDDHEKNEEKIEKIEEKIEKNEKNAKLNDVSMGSKIVEIVNNNEKALKLLKKQKNFSQIGLSNKLFETDKNKENFHSKTTKFVMSRPLSAQFFHKDNSVAKNESSKRPFSSKPLNKSEFKEIVNYHVKRKSQNLSLNTNNSNEIPKHTRVLSGGFMQRRRSSGGVLQKAIPNNMKGILKILTLQNKIC